MKKQILFVDDEPAMLDSLGRMLRSRRDVWEMTFLDSAEAALEHLQRRDCHAAVLDVRMPGMNGLDLLARLQQTARTRDLPVVMLTGLEDHALKRRALELGATDLLTKPVHPADLLARLRSVLKLGALQEELKAQNCILEEKVEQRTLALAQSRLDLIWRLGKVAEQRDEETGNHVIRVGFFSRALAEAMSLSREFVEHLFLAAPLHDIGKIGIPDRILLKQGSLGQAERGLMERHCVIGERILREDCQFKGAMLQWRASAVTADPQEADNPLLEMAASIALSHHEHWDGSGYPRELVGDEIPLEGRIVAIADTYDAMISARPYRPACPEEWALEVIHEAVGKRFDPAVYRAFVKALPEIRLAREQFCDEPSDHKVGEDASDAEPLVCR